MAKVKKIRSGKRKVTASGIGFVLLSLLLTAGLFVGLIILQDYLSDEIVYQQVIVAKADIPENTIITEENASDYFTFKQINVLDLTEGVLQNADKLLGQKARVDIVKGETVMLKDFENLNVYTANFKEPVEVSISISDIANADGGKLRAGDLINLTMMFTNEQLGIEPELKNTNISSGSYFNDDVSFNTWANEEAGIYKEELPSEEEILPEEENSDEIIVSDEETPMTENMELPEGSQDEEITAQDEEITAETEMEEVIPVISEETIKENIPKESASAEKEKTPTEKESSNASTTKSYIYESWAQYVMESLYINKVLDSSGTEIDSTDTTSNASIIIFTIEKEDEANLNNALMNCSNMRISKVVNKPIIKDEGKENE